MKTESKLIIAGTIILLIIILVGIHLATPVFIQVFTGAELAILVFLLVALPVALALGVWLAVIEIQGRKRKHQRFAPSEQGYYEALLIENRFIKPADNVPLVVPHTYSPRIEMNNANELRQLPAPTHQHHQPPTEDFLLSHIKPNSYTVSPGIRAGSGEAVLIDITTVPHGKLIGCSGFGKSTCMYIMLKQAAETNHPQRLQLALLDLEHKTSRLLEDYPHVASFRIGKRLIQMVATNADQVAEYLGYLKLELDRRTQLSEAELLREPILIMYVEEMLSLQYEVIDPKLLQTIFTSLTMLSIRGKKYGMFLYACMQTDYSTDELRISQKMFRFRGAASVDVSAARSAGFINTDLVKQNFQHGKPGQIVVEYPSFSDLVIVPDLELKQLLSKKTGFPADFQTDFAYDPETETPATIPILKGERNLSETTLKTDETSRQARFQEIKDLYLASWGKVKIIEKVYSAKPGKSKKYLEAEAEYEQIIAQLEQEKIGA